jgi:hypothetical protein
VTVDVRTAARAAYVAAALNLAAPAVMLILLREGLPSPGSTPADRETYIGAHIAQWRAGWLVWHAAALALLGLYAALAIRWWQHAPLLCILAVLCAGCGFATDMAGQAIAMGVLPQVSGDTFTMLERVSLVLTGYTGNGGYTLGGIFLTWAGAAILPRPLVVLAAAAWIAGVGLSAASIVHSDTGQIGSTAILMPLVVTWCLLIGRWMERRAS